MSPEDKLLAQIKRKREAEKNKLDDDEGFWDLAECEEGASPKVIFEKKK